MIAALFVETDGIYFGLPHVDPWDQARDARNYPGDRPVVAHPPCQRWGRFWHGSTRKPHQFQLGADDGCFAAALAAVRRFGGVLEHPADSRAWGHFNLNSVGTMPCRSRARTRPATSTSKGARNDRFANIYLPERVSRALLDMLG